MGAHHGGFALEDDSEDIVDLYDISSADLEDIGLESTLLTPLQCFVSGHCWLLSIKKLC
jgi:hypothetical protein